MVGKNRVFTGNGPNYSTGRDERPQNGHAPPRQRRPDDLERGLSNYSTKSAGRPRPRVFKFQDLAQTALEDRRRANLQDALFNNIDRHGLEKFRKSDADLKAIRNKKVRSFYENQNERLNDWLEVDAVVMAIADDVLESMDPDPDHDGDLERRGALQNMHGNIAEFLPEEEKKNRAKAGRRAKWAININVIANVALLAGKIVAVASTGSLSLVASLVDSALDLLCTLIIWTTNKLVGWRLGALKKRFPVGRRRLEPIGILVFSIIMVISFLQILKESVEKLAPLEGEAEKLPYTAIGAMVATIVIKGIIGLGCYRIKTTQVQALAQDCKTDVFFNTLSLLFPFIGEKANVWWLDPAGAGLLSLFIIYDWGHTCFENVTRLSGEAASTRTYQKLMYLAWRFSPIVLGFKNVTAYHCGDGVWVEYDLLLDEKTSLRTCHDVAETLQYCAEGLNEVDRAFVTSDYSSSGPAGHAEDAERNN
ncbi:hypothetical protein AB5N19_10040 [Seiridium cardinale]|uniref:Cation efflux protein transmembrane domain-containing protein n=1 Tax=Seiridium cardinale TaxID=138064 RepID=A0ABR2YAF4_9PEZI